MKKNDIILVTVVGIIAVIMTIIFLVTKETGNRVIITVDSKKYKEVYLKDNDEFLIETDEGYNKVIIKDGKVWVEEADCENHLCISQGKISNSNETIVCLPHKLIITVE